MSSCDLATPDSLMVGMWMNNCSNLYCIESAYCSKPKHNGVLGTLQCRNKSISWSSVASYNGCDDGEFMGGIGRLDGNHDLSSMNEIRCCKIKFGGSVVRRSEGSCYEVSFNGLGKWYGDNGSTHFLVGLWKEYGLTINKFNKGKFCTYEF